MTRAWLLLVTACGGGDSRPANDAATDATVTACSDAAPWASAPALPLGPTQETAVVAAAGTLYVLGGFDGNGNILAAVQVFDPATCTWSSGPPLPRAIHHANAAVVGDTLYVLGALQGASFGAIGDVWAWNPMTDSGWLAKTPMPAGTQRGSAVTGVIDGKIYVAGGLRGGAVGDTSVYDPVADTWTPLPAMPMSRDHGCGGAIAGKLYVAGGRQGAITSNSPFVYELTPGGGWVEKAAMPTGRGGTACGVAGDRLIVVGGEGNRDDASGVFPQVEAYTASTNTWASLAPMPTPRHGMGAAVIDGKLYVPGGATKQGFGAVATFEVLTP